MLCNLNNRTPSGKGVLQQGSGEVVEATAIRKGHTDVVEDVAWHNHNEQLLGSVGDDKKLIIWDCRMEHNKVSSCVSDAHDGDVNSLAFSRFDPYMLLTGGGDAAVKLWDLRNLSKPMHVLEGHNNSVMQVWHGSS